MFGGKKVGGIRISSVSHIDGPQTLNLTTTRSRRSPFTVQPLTHSAEAPGEMPNEVLTAAIEAAERGTEAFTAFWNGDGARWRDALRPNLDHFRSLAAEADAGTRGEGAP